MVLWDARDARIRPRLRVVLKKSKRLIEVEHIDSQD